MGIKGYVRHMNDLVLFGPSKGDLLDLKKGVERVLLQRLALTLKPAATHLNRTNHGLSFLGMRTFPRFIRLRPENRRRSLKRMRSKVRAWRQGFIEEENMAMSLTSIVGRLQYFCPKAEIRLEAGA
jgi:RNA-directed DNA polymerase